MHSDDTPSGISPSLKAALKSALETMGEMPDETSTDEVLVQALRLVKQRDPMAFDFSHAPDMLIESLLQLP